MSFMTSLVEGYGFIPMDPERAKADAQLRVARAIGTNIPNLRKRGDRVSWHAAPLGWAVNEKPHAEPVEA
jgi:hypothetical protein